MREHTRRIMSGAIVALSLLASLHMSAMIPDYGRAFAMPPAAPDLIIESITWSPETPEIGDKITFTTTIRNEGDDAADSFHIGYYIDDDFLTSIAVNPPAPNDESVKTFTWQAQPGSHNIKGVADYDNLITESDETNNEITYAFSVLAPDLVIESMTWSPENPSMGDTITFNVTIKNQGSKLAACSNYEIYLDGNGRGRQFIPMLEPDTSTTITFPLTAMSGSHSVRAAADVLNQVKGEGSEENNEMEVTYTTAKPDLVIDTITWTPENPSDNTTVIFTATIKNQGSGKAEHSWMALFIDKTLQNSVFIDSLDPGATATGTANWTVETISKTFSAVADYTKRVTETDESNNENVIPLPTLSTDLTIQSITWSPSTPLIAHSTTFTVTVKNQGKLVSSYSTLNFYVDDILFSTAAIAGIDAGDTTTGNFTRPLQKSSHVIRANIDEENNVIESDESNNTMTKTVTCSYPSPTADLVINNISYTPENPTADETVTFTIDIKNQGTGNALTSHVAYYIDDVFITSNYVGDTAAGAITSNGFDWKALAGSHSLKVIIDCNDSIFETDENNNEVVITVPVYAPDLVVQKITWSPESPTAGDTVTCQVTVKNQGNHKAASSYVSYFVEGFPRGSHYVDEINAGDMVTKTFTWEAQAESQLFKAVIDKDNIVTEINESNNERTVSLPAPDLTIEDIAWSPSSPSDNTTITFSVTIKNLGSGQSDNSSFSWYIDEDCQVPVDIVTINPGDTSVATFTWTAQAGEHVFKAVTDETNGITESNESNNEKITAISVLPQGAAISTPSTESETSEMATADLQEQESTTVNVAASAEESEPPPIEETDIVQESNIPEVAEEPSSIISKLNDVKDGFLQNWLFMAGVGGAGIAAIAALLVIRKRQSKPSEG